MRANQIQASVPAPVASLPPREPMPTVHFSMAIDIVSRAFPGDVPPGGVSAPVAKTLPTESANLIG